MTYCSPLSQSSLELPCTSLSGSDGTCLPASDHPSSEYSSVMVLVRVILLTPTVSGKQADLITTFTLCAVYLVVITATNTANVAFFAQQDSSLKGSAMAFQFLFASLMSCRMVLSLRDIEMLTVQSAAASLATRSFWKTGYTGNEDEKNGNTGGRRVRDDEAGHALDNLSNNGKEDLQSGFSRNGVPLPTYVDPLTIQ